MKKLSLLFLALISVLALAGCAERYETKTVEAEVVDLDYDKAYTKTETKKSDGTLKTSTKNVPAEYDVTLEYDGVTEEIDDKDLYESVKLGDKVKVTLKEGFTEENELVSRKLIYND